MARIEDYAKIGDEKKSALDRMRHRHATRA